MNIIHLESSEQLSDILKDHPFVVVDFYSDECPPCEILAPKFERLANRYTLVQFVKIFRQENRELAHSLGVSGSPTVLFFYRGNLQGERLSGEIQEDVFAERLDGLLANEEIVMKSKRAISSAKEYDLCILGSGPAGLTASIYAARYHVNHVLVGELAGGLMTSSHKICNYPSENEISGMDLTNKMLDHVNHLEIPVVTSLAESIKKIDSGFEIVLANEELIHAKTVLLATGTKHRHLGVAEEDRFLGRGLSYCATCDAAFFKDKVVAVIGGSDSANTASLYLAEIAQKVYQIYRGSELRGETAWIEQISKNPKIELILNSTIKSLVGDSVLNGVLLDRVDQGEVELSVDGLFVEIGSDPDGTLIQRLGIETDAKGYVVTQSDQRTSVSGIWAAGDITTNSDGFRQIVTACSEGAIAARSIFYALKKGIHT